MGMSSPLAVALRSVDILFYFQYRNLNLSKTITQDDEHLNFGS